MARLRAGPTTAVVSVVAAGLVWLLSQVDRHLIVLPAVLGVVLVTYVCGPRPGAVSAVALVGVSVVVGLLRAEPVSAGDVLRILLLAGGATMIVALGERAARSTAAAEQLRVVAVAGRRSAETAQARLRVFMDAAPVGMCLLDGELRVVRANPAMAEIVGVELDRNPRLADLGQIPAGLGDAARRVLQSGQPVVEREMAMPTPDGERWLLVSGYPVEGTSPADAGVGLTVQDVTERHRQTRRLELVAAASAALESAPTVQQRLDALCRHLAEEWTDLAVALLGWPHGLRAAALQTRRPADRGALLDILDVAATVPGGPLHAAIEGRRALHLGAAELAADAAAQPAGRTLSALDLSSALVAPLSAAGQPQPLGLIVVATTTDSGRQHRPHEIGTIAEIARLAVPAVQNGMLYERETLARRREASRSRTLSVLAEQQQRIARTLQSALLPSELPKVDGLELGAAYRAAVAGMDVGGDVYDVFVSGDAVLLMVADVAGKGPEAAAVTGTVRHTVRAEAEHETSPAAILRRLNGRLLAEQPAGPFCTAVLARLQPCHDGWRVAVARAGHPPPALLAGGEVQYVEPPGRLLGVLDDLDVVDDLSTLGIDGCLVLYSDGVTDVSRGADRLGEQGLLDLLATCADECCPPATVCEHVLDGVLAFGEGRLFDDVAVVSCRAIGLGVVHDQDAGPPED